MRRFIIPILIAAAFLRLFNLNYGDTLTDEVLYAFRAIGMLDFGEAAEQTTPLEWFDARGIPWWTRISFHDHPPLVFLTQYASMKLLGEKSWAFRLPSALLGVLSIYLLYLLLRELYSKDLAMVSAAIFAITINHVYISRLGFQESYVVFFILLTLYFFVRSQAKDTNLIFGWIAFGLGILTKYTTAVALPILLWFLFWCKRERFYSKKFWIGALLALLIVSPVIFYNLFLWRAIGHFDFQLSYIFGQDHPEWQVQPGKEIGSLKDRVLNFPSNILGVHSWLFLLFALGGFLMLTVDLLRNPKKAFRQHGFLLAALFFHAVVLLVIGTAYRFVSMLTPWLAVLVGLLLMRFQRYKKIFIILLVAILIFEFLYTANSLVTLYPIGAKTWFFAKGARLESYNWGFYALDMFMQNELAGRRPAAAFYQKYKFLERLHGRALEDALRKGLKERSAVFVYDGNIDTAAQLWVLDRWQIYHAWPVVRTEAYLDYLRENNVSGIKDPIFAEHYFIALGANVPRKRPSKQTNAGRLFEEKLLSSGFEPVTILKNPRGDEMFRLYSF